MILEIFLNTLKEYNLSFWSLTFEAYFFMGSVAKRLVFGTPTAAKGGYFVSFFCGPILISDFDITISHQRSIGCHFDNLFRYGAFRFLTFFVKIITQSTGRTFLDLVYYGIRV